MALITTAYEVPRAEPVVIVVADQAPPPANINSDEDCNCGVPPNASKQVQTTRKISVLIIAIHVIALLFGQVFWGQFIAALIAISTGCAVVCQFNKCAYTLAAVLYAIGMILDIVSVLFWIMNAEALAEDVTDDDIDEDQTERTMKLFSLTPAVGALCQFVGVIAAITAVSTWENSGAPDAIPIIESSSPARFHNNISSAT